MTLLSVIIPVYNVEKYLERCVESVINQTYKNLEIILVNDGSTDKSGEICDELAKKDSRIKVYHKENGGSSSARNYGIEKSSGEYITFVDSDDYIDLELYEKSLNHLVENKLDIVIFEIKNVYNNKKTLARKIETKTFKKEEAIKEFLIDKISMSVCDKIFSRKLFKEYEIFPEGKIAEDHLGSYRLLKEAEKVGTLKSDYYYYYVLDDVNSNTRNKMKDSVLYYFEMREEVIKDIKTNFKNISKDYLEAHMISPSIFLKSRLVSEEHFLSEASVLKINDYFDKYKFKALTNKYKRYYLITILIMLNLYSPIRKLKKKIKN